MARIVDLIGMAITTVIAATTTAGPATIADQMVFGIRRQLSPWAPLSAAQSPAELRIQQKKPPPRLRRGGWTSACSAA